MSQVGSPRYLCPECEELFERATNAREPEEINEAIEKIGESLESADNDDKFILNTVNEVLASAKERRELIESGVYDFENDAAEEAEGDGDVPDELRESEEDRILDEKEEIATKKFDKVMNYVSGGLIIAIIAAIIYFAVKMFL